MSDSPAPDASGGATIHCIACQSVLPADATFCLRCGVRQPHKPSAAGLPAVPDTETTVGTFAGLMPAVPLPPEAPSPRIASTTSPGVAPLLSSDTSTSPGLTPPNTTVSVPATPTLIETPAPAESQFSGARTIIDEPPSVAPPAIAPESASAVPVVPAVAPESPAAVPEVPAVAPEVHAVAPEVPAVAPVAAAPMQVAPTAPVAPVQATPAETVAVRSANKTIVGMTADDFKSIGAAPAQSPVVPVVQGAGGATMHGVAAAPRSAPNASPNAASALVGVLPATSGRTMMGVVLSPPTPEAKLPTATQPGPYGVIPAPSAVPAAGPFPPSSGTVQGGASTPSVRPRREAAPMMGGVVPGVPPDTFPPTVGARNSVPAAPTRQPKGDARGQSPTAASADTTLDDDIVVPGLPRRSKSRTTTGTSSPPLALFGILSVVAVILGAVGLYALKHRTARLQVLPATVRAAPGGLAVRLTLPNAPAGARLRYGATEVPVGPDGAVEFTATDIATRVGTIDLSFEMLDSSGDATPFAARIFIGYRVEPNFLHLADDPPSIHLEFRVPVGASLWVAEQPIRVVDDRGVAQIPSPAPIRVTAADPASRDRYSIRVRTAEGVEVRGEYELRVPRTSLRVDAPQSVSLTTNASETVRGRSPNAARVMVGATPSTMVAATLRAGAFTATVPLVRGRNEVDVVAYANNGAPASSPVVIYRDVSAQTYLGSNPRGVDAVLGDNPAPGVHLRLSGVVVQRSVAGAEPGVFQIAVDDRRCPSGRCGVLVSPPSAVGVVDGARVEIVGETSGVRTYTTAANERRTVALVTALFVTPR